MLSDGTDAHNFSTGLAEALEWVAWACNPTDDDECWFCRQELEEEDLIKCNKCTYGHCKSCMATSKAGEGLCKFCNYCQNS